MVSVYDNNKKKRGFTPVSKLPIVKAATDYTKAYSDKLSNINNPGTDRNIKSLFKFKPTLKASHTAGESNLKPRTKRAEPAAAEIAKLYQARDNLSLEDRRRLVFGPDYVPQKERAPVATRKPSGIETIRGTDRENRKFYEQPSGRGLEGFTQDQLYSTDRTKIPGLVGAVSNLIEDRRVTRRWERSPTEVNRKINREYLGNLYGVGSDSFVNPNVESGFTETTTPGRDAGSSVTGGWYDPITGVEYRTKRGAILGRTEERIDKDVTHSQDLETQNLKNVGGLERQRESTRGVLESARIRKAGDVESARIRGDAARQKATAKTTDPIKLQKEMADLIFNDDMVSAAARMRQVWKQDEAQAKRLMSHANAEQQRRILDLMKSWEE